jgi:tRNA dimethylallyltransferase
LSEKNKIPILVITGPTATGKSRLAVAAAEMLKEAEIISMDSMQLYRHMDIGTDKPPKDFMDRVPHHLVDVLGPLDHCSTAKYRGMCEDTIKDVFGRGKLPILVGGTGLYLKSLLEGIFPAPPVNQRIRDQLAREGGRNPGMLHDMLMKIDPERADILGKNDIKRLVRGLEVYLQTGETMTQLQAKQVPPEPGYEPLIVALTGTRGRLHERINKRVNEMIEAGFIDEVRVLLKMGLNSRNVAYQAIGYRSIMLYLRNELTLQEVVRDIKKDTRRYAKRQQTWFRGLPNKCEFDVTEQSSETYASQVCEQVAARFGSDYNLLINKQIMENNG